MWDILNSAGILEFAHLAYYIQEYKPREGTYIFWSLGIHHVYDTFARRFLDVVSVSCTKIK